ncbi:hypothetical protein [Mesorhizobium australicum]|uniref:hypothetical protein n=1 Tax=Mesorhizobium australicum TaxID=536018 RepID=UPI0033358A99
MNFGAIRRVIASGMFILNFVLAVALIYLFVSRGMIEGAGWSAVDLVTVLLSLVSILLTVIGIFIAVLAIWGYGALRAIVVSRAEEITNQTLSDTLARLNVDEGADYGAAAGKDTEHAKPRANR